MRGEAARTGQWWHERPSTLNLSPLLHSGNMFVWPDPAHHRLWTMPPPTVTTERLPCPPSVLPMSALALHFL